MEEGRKVVFISYSWEDEEHQEWVLKLAGDLQSRYGIVVLLDRVSITPGADLPYFMERSIDKADKVLVVLTPEYKTKAEARIKGVGYETTILSQELFESPITKIKIIPILRKGDKESSSPKFLSSKAYHSMVDNTQYEYQLLELAKAISDQPLIKLPPLGDVADLNSAAIDPFISKANNLANEERINREIDQLLFSHEGKRLADNEIGEIEQLLKTKKEMYEAETNLHFVFESNFRDKIIIKSYGVSVTIGVENLYSNTVDNLKLRIRYFKGNVSLGVGSYFPGEEPKKVREDEYLFDLNYEKQIVWKLKSEVVTKNEITTKIFNFILEKIVEERAKGFRGK